MYSRIRAVAPLHCTALAKSILMGIDPSLRDHLLADFDFPRFTDRTHPVSTSLPEWSDLRHIVASGWLTAARTWLRAGGEKVHDSDTVPSLTDVGT
jgi:DNA-binding IclR family transcriptional regulator